MNKHHHLTIGEKVYDTANEEWARVVRTDETSGQVLLESPDGKGMTWIVGMDEVLQNLNEKPLQL